MTESFPRQQARTRQFSLGVPRSFQISPDGSRLAFLRSRDGGDPVTCLWVLDVRTGHERLVADPATLGDAAVGITKQEKARRERVRDQPFRAAADVQHPQAGHRVAAALGAQVRHPGAVG